VIEFEGKGILLDIEGTTSSIRFVYDVLFPFARRELIPFLEANWDSPEVVKARGLIARDAGSPEIAGQRPSLITEVLRLMDRDAKTTGLKELQGLIWRRGYDSGVLCSHVYPDVPIALKAWTAAGLDLCIYSSGSVSAQKLFFAHTQCGDLTGFFRAYFDTTIGAKREAASYARIAAERALLPGEMLFLSDVSAELDAARAVGLHTGLVVRPGNPASPEPISHDHIEDFSQIQVTRNR